MITYCDIGIYCILSEISKSRVIDVGSEVMENSYYDYTRYIKKKQIPEMLMRFAIIQGLLRLSASVSRDGWAECGRRRRIVPYDTVH